MPNEVLKNFFEQILESLDGLYASIQLLLQYYTVLTEENIIKNSNKSESEV